MLINELAKRTGVTIYTLRYYENIGLIEGKTDEKVTSNNYKQYDILVEKLSWIMEQLLLFMQSSTICHAP